MPTLLFLDDWFVERRPGMIRSWGEPELVSECLHVDPVAQAIAYPVVYYDEKLGKYRCWHDVWGRASIQTTSVAIESDDGLDWKLVERGGDAQIPHRLGGGTPKWGGGFVFLDRWDPDPERRWKLVAQEQTTSGVLFGSADGYDWHRIGGVWANWHSDTCNCLYYNPFRETYHIICRTAWGDRRAAMVSSSDLETWSNPEVVVHPAPLDPPMLEFYGMPVFLYENYFFGFLWPMYCNAGEVRAIRMQGPLDTELTYSLNGVHFSRTHRTFVGRTELGDYGGGSMMSGALVVTPGRKIRIYGYASRGEHHQDGYSKDRARIALDPYSALCLHELRLDGFAALESLSDKGLVTTRVLRFSVPKLSLNAQVPFGWVRVQVTDENGVPYPGLSFDDSEMFNGDSLDYAPKWSEASLDQVVGKLCRVEVEVGSGRLYAIRFAGDVVVGLDEQRGTRKPDQNR